MGITWVLAINRASSPSMCELEFSSVSIPQPAWSQLPSIVQKSISDGNQVSDIQLLNSYTSCVLSFHRLSLLLLEMKMTYWKMATNRSSRHPLITLSKIQKLKIKWSNLFPPLFCQITTRHLTELQSIQLVYLEINPTEYIIYIDHSLTMR